MKQCGRDILCVDCDNMSCVHHGSMLPDCPKYFCDNMPFHDCEHCETMKEVRAKMRNLAKRGKENE